MGRPFTILGVLFFVATAVNAHATTITFDSGGGLFVHQESGFDVAFHINAEGGTDPVSLNTTSSGACPVACVDSGSRYISGRGAPTYISVQRSDGGSFSLVSFLGGELIAGHPIDPGVAAPFAAAGLLVVGFLDPFTATPEGFSLDRLSDGPGGIADFESFSLPPLFGNIIRAEFHATGDGANFFSLDDIVVGDAVAAVPEPASILLLATGLLRLARAGCRRRAAASPRSS
jgi:hypothetical protein